MKRNKALTLLFSFCPGAGQMFQGYMKRGLTLALIFAGFIILAFGYMPVLLALAAVTYMYSFFDSLNLSALVAEGRAPQDDFLIHLNLAAEDLKKLRGKKTHLLGWCCVALGVFGLYQTLFADLLRSFVWSLPSNEFTAFLIRTLNALPQVALGVAFLLVGIWLVKGGKKEEAEFEEYRGE